MAIFDFLCGVFNRIKEPQRRLPLPKIGKDTGRVRMCFLKDISPDCGIQFSKEEKYTPALDLQRFISGFLYVFPAIIPQPEGSGVGNMTVS